MRKNLILVGCRPNFTKASMFIEEHKNEEYILLHSGQHYDYEMSQLFFREFDLPVPDYDLGVKSSNIAMMIPLIKDVLKSENPDVTTVFGDANSTLAGALASVSMRILVRHVEAGCRSGNMAMIEEVNRIAVDHLSSFLVPPDENCIENLRREGVMGVVEKPVNYVVELVKKYDPVVSSGDYAVLTIHRQANADNKERLSSILRAVGDSGVKTVFPVHPRTRYKIEDFGIKIPDNIEFPRPMSYGKFLALEAGAGVVITDSGGVSVEADYLGKPCIVLRESTEWVDSLKRKAVLVGADYEKITREIEKNRRI